MKLMFPQFKFMKIGRGLSGANGVSSITKLSFPTQLLILSIGNNLIFRVQILGFGISINWGKDETVVR